MDQTRDTNERVWQGTMAMLLLVLVLFSDAIIGSEPERTVADTVTAADVTPHCETCVSVAAASIQP
jgi:hypothetical protein